MYTIGEFSKKIDIPIDTLRYYEKLGIIIPERTKTNRRIYSQEDYNWLEFIQRLKLTGMPLNQIVEYSNLRKVGDSTINKRIDMLLKQKNKLFQQQAKINDSINFLNYKLNIYKDKLQEIRSKKR